MELYSSEFILIAYNKKKRSIIARWLKAYPCREAFIKEAKLIRDYCRNLDIKRLLLNFLKLEISKQELYLDELASVLEIKPCLNKIADIAIVMNPSSGKQRRLCNCFKQLGF